MNIKEIMLNNAYESVEVKISKILRECNIYLGLNGYNYLKTAITLAFVQKRGFAITKEVYPYVAKKEGVTAASVERCMRHAIDRAWDLQKKTPSDILEEVFRYSKHDGKYRPTNTIFIAGIAEEMRLYS
jgi:two-component system response regulator (stage 0 sporulation protein A)